jgi:ABC-type glycerol-3-phosphate transport system substrate-binding protein
MSPKKIMFFVIIWIIALSMIIGILILQNQSSTTSVTPPETLKIWITDGTSLGYEALTAGFKTYAPEYKNTNIVFEKKTTDPIRYRTLLLKTMADGTGPDIFMVGAWEDSVIESRIEPIPSDVLEFGNFEKRYDDVFLPLIVSSGAEDALTTYIMGVPLGFETLGVFYNKTLIREFPRTWNDLDSLYNKGIDSPSFVAGLGLGPRYTPNAADIIALFYGRAGTTDITGIKAGANNGLASYMRYRDIAIVGATQDDAYAPIRTLVWEQADMETDKSTTIDLFVRGDIGMIYGYPSLIMELEKSDKRAGISSKAGVILTEKIPATSATSGIKNIAKFNFFALSKTTLHPEAGVKFLEYLMTSEAEKIFLQNNSYLVAAQREFWTAQKWTKLSNILSRTTMDAFIPDTDEEIFVFWYGLKAEFESFLSEYIDRNDAIDINNISEKLSHDLSCSIDTYSDAEIRPDCEKK